MRRLTRLAVCVGLLAACSTPNPPSPPQLPPLGWNSWNSGIPLTEQTVHDTIDAMVSSGMRDAGYRYVNLDAGWAAPTRADDGSLRADLDRFPHGIAALARYAHDRGMLLGIYHSPFNQGCGQDPRIGGAGHEQADAKTFASWGVDYLKYDWCRTEADHDDQVRYFTAMRDALRDSGRHIIYSINPNSSGDPVAGLEYDWSHIADVTRDAVDLVPAWGDTALWQEGLAGVVQAFAEADSLAPHSNSTHVNDPDMLVVGIGWKQFASGHPTMALGAPRADLTDTEQRAHFSLWAMLAAPLLAGNDIRDMTIQTRDILTNRDVIAVDQDPLMMQGRPLTSDARVVIKPLADGAVAVALFNQSAEPQNVRTSFDAIGLGGHTSATVRDLWQHTDNTSTGTIERQVPGHGVVMLRVTP
ncbi:alpha-galactosidase [Mycobacterium sp. 852013-50091_SCH5140682]|uniref:glycoside hydrolase family 27 protein n=1 Tax=Mycobacterium sp. 852013-50091_SCH5140682 TaxID=1834109 RepID=UPI0007EBDB06|nr:glycoside hydrolase family 27 protein [Mycobacterium sp. 852013-50091_SCH5140682]OBC05071.1 alpha-galactosidase [Mycobacterium sp. 852013-50091_SCH5140682]